MKLLLDQNLSRRLLPALELAFPGSSHIQLLGMEMMDEHLATIQSFLDSDENGVLEIE